MDTLPLIKYNIVNSRGLQQYMLYISRYYSCTPLCCCCSPFHHASTEEGDCCRDTFTIVSTARRHTPLPSTAKSRERPHTTSPPHHRGHRHALASAPKLAVDVHNRHNNVSSMYRFQVIAKHKRCAHRCTTEATESPTSGARPSLTESSSAGTGVIGGRLAATRPRPPGSPQRYGRSTAAERYEPLPWKDDGGVGL